MFQLAGHSVCVVLVEAPTAGLKAEAGQGPRYSHKDLGSCLSFFCYFTFPSAINDVECVGGLSYLRVPSFTPRQRDSGIRLPRVPVIDRTEPE